MIHFGHEEHQIPKSIYAHVMAATLANTRAFKANDNPFRLLEKHDDSILITLRGHSAMFKNISFFVHEPPPPQLALMRMIGRNFPQHFNRIHWWPSMSWLAQ
jgi:hypothetical protein